MLIPLMAALTTLNCARDQKQSTKKIYTITTKEQKTITHGSPEMSQIYQCAKAC